MKKNTCIMVVDDDQTVLRLLDRILKPAGYDVILASDGGSALKLAEQHSPDLVILDIMMPGLNGFQVLEFIREKSEVPVIMLTGVVEPISVYQSVNLGADDYVRKPFRTRELLVRIKNKLRRARSGLYQTDY